MGLEDRMAVGTGAASYCHRDGVADMALMFASVPTNAPTPSSVVTRGWLIE